MRIVGLAPWPYMPAQSGGTERTLNLFAALGEITSFAIDWQGSDDQQSVHNIDYRVVGAPLAARQGRATTDERRCHIRPDADAGQERPSGITSTD
jgi:hypothetical protein